MLHYAKNVSFVCFPWVVSDQASKDKDDHDRQIRQKPYQARACGCADAGNGWGSGRVGVKIASVWHQNSEP
jgi:hypothetical protein